MPLFTKKQFAEFVGIENKHISVYHNRNKIEYDYSTDKELIDTENETNKALIEQIQAKKGENIPKTAKKQVKEPKKVENTLKIPNPTAFLPKIPSFQPKIELNNTNSNKEVSDKHIEDENNDTPTLTNSTKKLKYLDTIKRTKEIEKLQIEIQKKKGEVVPVELIKPVILQHNQSILTEFKNAGDEILRIMSKKYSFSVEDLAFCKGEFVKTINNSMGKAIYATTKSIDSIIQNHIEKKGVGEHG